MLIVAEALILVFFLRILLLTYASVLHLLLFASPEKKILTFDLKLLKIFVADSILTIEST